MIVPFQQLPSETLENVIKDWLSRQAQEAFDTHLSEAELVEQVRELLKQENLLVSWDDESQTINLVTPESLLENQ